MGTEAGDLDESTRTETSADSPTDSDRESERPQTSVPKPVHLRWPYVGLVFVGGSVGTAARYFLSLVIPDWLGLPLGIFVINVSGAFALGLLLETLSRGGPDEGRRRRLRLLLGTGVLGGFTTYSSFVVDSDGLILAHQPLGSLVYAVATIVIGAAFSVAGIALGVAIHKAKARRTP